MLRYTTEQIASVIALPIIVILLSWTIVIFHKNRKNWGPYDIPIVSVLVLSVLRNITIFVYIALMIFTLDNFNTEYCSIITWLFNSIHTFQASSLTSIAVIGLFSAKLHRKSQNLRTFLTSTHIIYHLFCLTTLCACVGVAAILAQKDGTFGNVFAENYDTTPCTFLPFELDLKFNVFIIVLHVFLAFVSFTCFLVICYNFYKIKQEGFDYIKKSNSDLSELSNNFHGINTNVNDTRNFYDTYTINRNDSNNFKDTWNHTNRFNNSEILSNNSTTVSSTNSRRPCLVKHHQPDEEEEVEVRRTGLETIHPVLIVCYLFYHLPVIVLCVYPRLIQPWSVAGIAVWLGLVQDLLIPLGLGIVDSRFCGWVSDVYKCSAKRTEEKLPQVGLDGKFRPFGLTSQPQSLDINNQERAKSLQQVEHRFPITNGSLYTSIDGRLPVIHNYRRHKEYRTGTLKQQQDMHSSNVALHSSHLSRRDFDSIQNYSNCSNCVTDHCPSHSDLHHLSPQHVQRKLSFLQASRNNVFALNGERKNKNLAMYENCVFVGNRRLQNTQNSLQRNQIRMEICRQRNPVTQKRLSQSQESINHLYYSAEDPRINDNIYYHKSDMNISRPNFNLNVDMNNHMVNRNSKSFLRLNKMRLSRSEESLSNLQVESPIVITSNQVGYTQDSSDDEDDFFNNEAKDYDSLSSSNSITTEANCDFDFYHAKHTSNNNNNNNNNNNKDLNYYNPVKEVNGKPPRKHVSNTKITRSSSRRSLENFQSFVEEVSGNDLTKITKKNENNISRVTIVHRSNSFSTLEVKGKKPLKKCLSRSNSKTSESIKFDDYQTDMKKKKIKSMEYLPNATLVYKNDMKNNNWKGIVGNSVPDFKKVFISDYI
ncbi:hypothetical protein ABEB36_006631 [Hypothenemus hampei]|uniref:G-protein coupled receptors family 1 profile domain-containing protein n=1 Tax=Hypothenemus hampei TaxID=57062 RepID=A0ABD1ERZ4_HYPHA